MNKKWYILLIGVFLISLVCASNRIYQQGTDVELSFVCTNNGTFCSSAATCNATIINPNGIIVFENNITTRNGAAFNITFNSTYSNELGRWELHPVCFDNGFYNSGSYEFWITPNGEILSEGQSMFYIGILLLLIIAVVLCIYGMVKIENIGLKTFFFYGIYLSVMMIFYFVWILSESYLTTSSFFPFMFKYLFITQMIILFPLVLATIVWYLWLIITIKPIQRMIDSGVPEDRALAGKIRGDLRDIESGIGNPKKW